MSPDSIAPEYSIRSFLENQINLDIMTYLSMGKTYREIGEKIGRKQSFVQSQSEYLRKCGLLINSRWNVDINALGMLKTFEFCSYSKEDWDRIFKKDFFLSYLSQIKMGQTKYLAMHTFPEEEIDKVGSEMTSWYFTFPHFEVPFMKNNFIEEKFFEVFEKEDNKNPLPPRGEKIQNPDLIDFFICKHVQLETGDVNLEKYTERMEEEIGDVVDVSLDNVRSHFQTLKDKHIIYPVIPLDFTEIYFTSIYWIVSLENIFKVMKTLNRFNILTGISFIEENKNLLFIQCPYNWHSTIAAVFDQLDRENKMFSVTKTYINRGLPYKYYLEKAK